MHINIHKLLSSLTLLGLVSASSSGCAQESKEAEPASKADNEKRTDKDKKTDQELLYDQQSKLLIDGIKHKGVGDERVLKALASIPRHKFVDGEYQSSSYDDNPLPIGSGQTISQPFIVAYMTEALKVKETDRVLEIGTGSGYQASVLSRLAKEVYSIEIIPQLSERAQKVLTALGINNIHFKVGDGYQGWSEEAPFDAIIITAAPPEIPEKLVDQLKVGGRLVVPVGNDGTQWLLRLTKKDDGSVERETLLPVRFVPMVPGSKKQ